MEFYIDIAYFLILFLAARVVIDRDTQQSRGFGFVTFYDERDVQTAIDQLDGQVKRLSTMMTWQETFFSIHLSLGTSTMCILLVRTTKLLVQKKCLFLLGKQPNRTLPATLVETFLCASFHTFSSYLCFFSFWNEQHC